MIKAQGLNLRRAEQTSQMSQPYSLEQDSGVPFQTQEEFNSSGELSLANSKRVMNHGAYEDLDYGNTQESVQPTPSTFVRVQEPKPAPATTAFRQSQTSNQKQNIDLLQSQADQMYSKSVSQNFSRQQYPDYNLHGDSPNAM